MSSAVDARIDGLYELPLESFVEERDELAKSLRREGRREEADKVKELGKPSAAAWVVNQAMRNESAKRRGLLRAAGDLREKQEALAEGKADAGELRASAEAEREAVDRLLESARSYRPGGRAPSEAVLERVRDTFHAAALDPGARKQLEAARLTRELSAVGFGLVAPGRSELRRNAGRRAATPAEERKRERDAAERRKKAQRQLKSATVAAKKAESALAGKRRELDKATKARDRAQRTVDKLEDESGRLEKRVAGAKTRVAEQEERLTAL